MSVLGKRFGPEKMIANKFPGNFVVLANFFISLIVVQVLFLKMIQSHANTVR